MNRVKKCMLPCIYFPIPMNFLLSAKNNYYFTHHVSDQQNLTRVVTGMSQIFNFVIVKLKLLSSQNTNNAWSNNSFILYYLLMKLQNCLI